ncbi:unnamed protein product [Brachionus calyciflorus]|uniref:RING-type E3 ubiquitin transferase n=1 Tax=Brachionus calyciflorus TaxID=104777 RepID=A0A813M2L5_9BILA|nr:unnamed protein product [Brachionus calyciflorus]
MSLGQDDNELLILAQTAGFDMDPELFKVILDLIRLNVNLTSLSKVFMKLPRPSLYLVRIFYLILKKLNQISFYFKNEQSFITIENRLTNTKYISLNPNSSNSNNDSIHLIGFVKLLNLLLNFVHLGTKFLKYKPVKNITKNENIESNETKSYPTKCLICLEQVNTPTVTQCGHVFCWYCIQRHVLNFKKNSAQITCPSCRLIINSNKLICLNNF